MRFLVLDTETTDLDALLGHVVEVAAVRVELAPERQVVPVFKSFCNPGLPLELLRSTWICTAGDLNPGAVLAAPPVSMVAGELRELVRDEGLPWTSWNLPFDESFLLRPPWDLPPGGLPCLMRAAAPACGIPGYYGDYKWPSLEEAYQCLKGVQVNGAHRAEVDARRAAELAIELHRLEAVVVPAPRGEVP